jgi:dephospho-CoA kinase
MLKVGLTGGIATGKSLVGEMFVALGAHLIQADRIAHDLMQPGEEVYAAVVRRFGKSILNDDHTINRTRLAEAAFGAAPATSVYGNACVTKADRNKPATHNRPIDDLNRIVHPAVIRRQEEWMDQVGHNDPRAVAIVEAALILEAGAARRFDRLIVVTCRDDQRVRRFAERQKLTLDAARKEVERRMAAQLPDEEKIKAADFVIDNSGSLDETQAQVRQTWQMLQTSNTNRPTIERAVE